MTTEFVKREKRRMLANAYLRGERAKREGKAPDANPYTGNRDWDKERHAAWNEGYGL